ncbi:hypothetical protein [Nocardiopsis quinghaiensis]
MLNEGCTATSGAGWMRPELRGEAMRLGRVLAGPYPSPARDTGPPVAGLNRAVAVSGAPCPTVVRATAAPTRDLAACGHFPRGGWLFPTPFTGFAADLPPGRHIERRVPMFRRMCRSRYGPFPVRRRRRTVGPAPARTGGITAERGGPQPTKVMCADGRVPALRAPGAPPHPC